MNVKTHLQNKFGIRSSGTMYHCKGISVLFNDIVILILFYLA